MFLHHPSFTNRPTVDATFLPKNFNLNSLRTSGWYAPLGALQNAPENFTLYQLFVVAPNPDVYATQLAFGVAYKIVSPHEEEGDTTIVDGEVMEDIHGNAVYTNKRAAVDFNNDGVIDTPLDSVYVDVNNEKYNILRVVTNGTVVHSNNENENDTNENTNIDNDNAAIEKNKTTELSTTEPSVQAKAIIDDSNDVVVTNRSAIYMRSYVNGSWTSWNTFGSVAAQTNPGGETSPSTPISDIVESGELAANFEKLYTYVDNKLTFLSSMPGVELYGLQVELTGSYNESPYDPSYNVYGVAAQGIEYDGIGDFPETGDPQKLYIAKDENRLYRWDEESGWHCVGSDYNEIINISSDMGALPQVIPGQENNDNDEEETQTEP